MCACVRVCVVLFYYIGNTVYRDELSYLIIML